jgi:hypothetical protein
MYFEAHFLSQSDFDNSDLLLYAFLIEECLERASRESCQSFWDLAVEVYPKFKNSNYLMHS